MLTAQVLEVSLHLVKSFDHVSHLFIQLHHLSVENERHKPLSYRVIALLQRLQPCAHMSQDFMSFLEVRFQALLLQLLDIVLA